MNEIDAWLACDEDGRQDFFISDHPTKGQDGTWRQWGICEHLCQTHGHDIPPGQCRPVRLRVEVLKDDI